MIGVTSFEKQQTRKKQVKVEKVLLLKETKTTDSEIYDMTRHIKKDSEVAQNKSFHMQPTQL